MSQALKEVEVVVARIVAGRVGWLTLTLSYSFTFSLLSLAFSHLVSFHLETQGKASDIRSRTINLCSALYIMDFSYFSNFPSSNIKNIFRSAGERALLSVVVIT